MASKRLPKQGFRAMFSENKGDLVYKTGKIFAVGDYPSHDFTLSMDEAVKAVMDFKPVPVDLEHQSTMLDGKLGQLVHVDLMDDNTTLVGTYAQPRWLSELLGDMETTVSLTWEEEAGDKQIVGLALTSVPAVKDAVMFSRYVEFAGSRHSAADTADIQAMHDLTVKQGADCGDCPKCGAPMKTFTQKGGKRMSIFSKLLGGRKPEDLGLSPEEIQALGTLTGDEPIVGQLLSVPDPRIAVLETELAAQKAQFSQLASQGRKDKATATVDGLIRGNKLWPYERNEAISSLVQDMEDDAANPKLIEFTDAKGAKVSRTREQSRIIQFESRVPHNLTQEQLRVILPNAPVPDPTQESEEEHAAKLAVMLAMTPEGKAALKEFTAAK